MVVQDSEVQSSGWWVRVNNEAAEGQVQVQLVACSCKQGGLTEAPMGGHHWLELGGAEWGSEVDLEMEADNRGPCKQGRETSWRQDLCFIRFVFP